MTNLDNYIYLPFEKFMMAEVFIAIASLLLLLYAVFIGDKSSNRISLIGVAILAIAIFFIEENNISKNLLYNFLAHLKQLICFLSALCLILFIGHSKYNIRNRRAEYPVLILFSVLGMLILISAEDFLTFYLGLELMSFTVYILTAINREYIKSSEAALKYFILGALASGFILFGISILYGVSGSINFVDIQYNLKMISQLNDINNFVIILAIVFVVTGMLFKVSAVPFHMWTPDVYEGSPTPVIVFISSVPKVAAFIILFRILNEPFFALVDHWSKIIYIAAIMSMIVGALGAINQTNFKRLLAYSTINHVGLILIALVYISESSIKAMIFYLAIYGIMIIGAFAFLMVIKQSHASSDSADKKLLEDISSFAGIAKQLPYAAFAIAVLMLSMAGLPPFAGFFAKFYIFMAALENNYAELAIIGAVSTIISAFYYLRLIKIVYFDKPIEEYSKSASAPTIIVLLFIILFNLLMFLYPMHLLDFAGQSTINAF